MKYLQNVNKEYNRECYVICYITKTIITRIFP